MPVGDCVLVLGRPHNGKSWCTEQLAVCLATGKKFLQELAVRQSSVILIDEDTPTNVLLNRLARLANGFGQEIAKLPIHIFSHHGFMLYDKKERDWLIAKILDTNSTVVIMDSLEKVVPGFNLNRSDIASRVGGFIDELKSVGTTVIINHHMTLKKDVLPEEFDLTHLAMGSTRIIADSDTALCIFRIPTKNTEFTIIPQERRTKLNVSKLSFVLREDAAKTWAMLVIMEEKSRMPSKLAKYIVPLFLTDGQKLTVKGILEKVKGGVSDREIRVALSELEDEMIVRRGREAHNRYVYAINDGFCDGKSLTTPYWEALQEKE